MGRIFKVLAIVAGAVVLLFVAVIIGVAMLFDPNDYRDDIAAAVERQTGRELTLVGDLELELFPRIRIAVGEAVISNAPGFGDEPFARIGSARLQLALFPLLARRVEIGEARLEGLVLNLARDAQGRNNWQDLGGAAEDSAPTAEAEDGTTLNFAVDAFDIVNAEVNWRDAATGGDWQLSGLNLRAADFGPETAFPLRLEFGVAGEAVEVRVNADARATVSLAQNRYLLERLDVRLAGSGDNWPGGSGEARLRFDSLAANLEAETLDLDNLTLDFLGISARGSLTGRELLGNLRLEGAVDIAPFNPTEVLRTLGVQIETADPRALRTASARANLLYDPRQVALGDMRLTLDDSELTGRVGMEGEALRFNLQVNAINIDRYLPPAEEPGPVAEEGTLDEVDLPLEVLRVLNAAGELAIGQAQLMGLTLSDTVFALTAGNGTVRLVPRSRLYGGTYSGEIRLQAQAEAARLTLTSDLAGVDLLPLARDLMDFELVSGTGAGRLNLTSTGANVGQMRQALTGDVAFTFRDGAWEGVDMWYELRRARALLDRQSAPPREGPRRTPYSEVAATGVVRDLVLATNDLRGTLDFMTISGAGTVHLVTDELDFELTARFVDGPTLQSDPAMAGLAGAQLPLTVSGTLEEPSIRPDFGAAVRERAREEVRERLEEEEEELRDRVRDRLRGIFNR